MKYMGSKNRIAKYILPIMLEAAEERGITTWVEPFVGGGNMIDKVPNKFKRIGLDSNPHAIQALIAIRDFIGDLPNSLSEQEYKKMKNSDPSPINSWLRFVASFGGKFDNGYAREKGSTNETFVGYGKRNAQKQNPKLQNVDLICKKFEDISYIENSLIYCDPPYAGTTGYKTHKFDHYAFFDWCRKMSEKNIIFISEYNAPLDFKCIWEGQVKTNFDSGRKGASHIATEKLFTVDPNQ